MWGVSEALLFDGWRRSCIVCDAHGGEISLTSVKKSPTGPHSKQDENRRSDEVQDNKQSELDNNSDPKFQ